MNEPITVEQARAYMNMDTDDVFYDDLLRTVITGERLALERELDLYLTPRTVIENFRRPCCGQPCNGMYNLKRGPVAENVVIKDLQGNVLQYDNYGSNEWPKYQFTHSVDITYNAGYISLPEDLKLALLMRVATAWQNRENSTTDQVNMVLNTSRKLSQPYSRNVF